jgi:hypothetical protein
MPFKGSHNWTYYGSTVLAVQVPINVPTLARDIEGYGIASHVHGEARSLNSRAPPFKSSEFPSPVPRVQLSSHLHLRGRKHSYLIDPLKHVLIYRLGPAAHLIGHVFARKRALDRCVSPPRASTRHNLIILLDFRGFKPQVSCVFSPPLAPCLSSNRCEF